MGSYVIDSELFRGIFSTDAMRAVWSDRQILQKWLDMEAALARAEAEAGVIPADAATEIARVADAELYDLGDLRREMERTAHPIVPVVRAMAALCRGDAGGWVHWGTTTQDVTDTGTVLQMKDSLGLIEEALAALEAEAAGLARTHRDTVMAGRTHGQQALPLTFGYKAAVWVDELRRHRRRLAEARPRILVGQFGGAVGTLASVGAKGPEIQRRMMEILGLGVPEICWHAARDRSAEYAFLMALCAATAAKIAEEVALLQRTEIAELEEPNPHGKVGSSTMPHKRNPHICENIAALARTTREVTATALQGAVFVGERDRPALQTEREYMARVSCHAHAALCHVTRVLAGLDVRTANMRRNLDATKGLLLSEAVMLKLGEKLGRQVAHDIVYDACMDAFESARTMKEALMERDEVRAHFSGADIDALLSPDAYTGLAGHFVDRVLGDGD